MEIAKKNIIPDSITKYIDLPEEWKQFLVSPRPAVIYGAGRQATVVHDFCILFGKTVFCLMASSSRQRWGMLPSEDKLPLYLVEEFPLDRNKDDFDIIVAVNPTHNDLIAAILQSKGWPHVTLVEDWEVVNALTRKIFYTDYLSRRGGHWHQDAQGLGYVECPTDYGIFKIYVEIDPVYQANLWGDFNNIILPMMFNDCSCLSSYGPYEYGEVALHPGDTVLDLGACIGLFSCAAAARGCKVYSFEPTPSTTIKYLQKNASLYKSITVVPKAVLDKVKDTFLYVNDKFTESFNITRNSIHQNLEPTYTQITVQSTTIDDYVKSNKLQTVNFIKSHTEYAEHILLDGAKNTLRYFAPHLSFYSQKALGIDRYKLIEKKILTANPHYRFCYKWRRLFAWVPNNR